MPGFVSRCVAPRGKGVTGFRSDRVAVADDGPVLAVMGVHDGRPATFDDVHQLFNGNFCMIACTHSRGPASPVRTCTSGDTGFS
ncbi:hypothetical protein CFB49_03460 [Burkholderia sp. AU17457]|nr:hypothetical protein CFB49_03460 [Burkholderia sp. AU17457]